MEPPQDSAGGGRKRRRRGGGRNRRKSSSLEAPPLAPPVVALSPPAKRRRKAGEAAAAPKGGKPTSLLEKMRARLSGGHFRMLNEKLYTCSGQDAFDYFKNEPKLFDVYHAGYQEQMSHWPEQPVNVIINWLKSHNASWTVADFGCGNAAVAKNVKNKVFSIDLVSDDPSVIACDMAHEELLGILQKLRMKMQVKGTTMEWLRSALTTLPLPLTALPVVEAPCCSHHTCTDCRRMRKGYKYSLLRVLQPLW